MGWLTDALLSVVMSKDAREKMRDHRRAVEIARELGELVPPAPPPPPLTASQALDRAASSIAERKAKMTPERQALIQGAMAVRRAKQGVLADLSEEDRARLMALALRQFRGES
ncbi:MAG: hypothetical protein A2516_03815 [Alphaproteobacteria bacterium RIFOXYD12_FULL_60_8]|nr:MAG: hypothetical protein A2516_03815 [Alphaproteobacteria bacterium RIFOXYD12_FULL_60_8]